MLGILASMSLIIAVIGLLVAAVINKKKKEKERTQALRLKAEELGWAFEPTAPVRTIPGIERFALFELGAGGEIENLMYGAVDGVTTTVFDYIYTTGGKYRTTYFQSVVLFEPNDLTLPDFALRPEGVFDRLCSAFGYQDIDFDHRAEFSRQYILRGEDEAAIRQTFNDRVLSFYESNPGTFTDAVDNQLFLYRVRVRLQPDEIESYIKVGLQILALMRPD